MADFLKIPFSKFHGLGNDFLVAGSSGLPKSLVRLARAMTDRRTGVGADGLIIVMPPRNKAHDALVRFFNADGSEAEMSGNGIRCAAAFLLSGRRATRPLRIETQAGIKNLELLEARDRHWVFRVGMGAPILDPKKIPFRAPKPPHPVIGYPLRTHRGLLPVTVTSMGNPHCTVFVAGFAAFDWEALGREIERKEMFPRRTNVEFVKVRSRREIEVRFWERGVGRTMSSGTGSCGATVACILNGLTERRVRVRTLAGELRVEWPEKGEVALTGPVEQIAQGDYFFPE